MLFRSVYHLHVFSVVEHEPLSVSFHGPWSERASISETQRELPGREYCRGGRSCPCGLRRSMVFLGFPFAPSETLGVISRSATPFYPDSLSRGLRTGLGPASGEDCSQGRVAWRSCYDWLCSVFWLDSVDVGEQAFHALNKVRGELAERNVREVVHDLPGHTES